MALGGASASWVLVPLEYKQNPTYSFIFKELMQQLYTVLFEKN